MSLSSIRACALAFLAAVAASACTGQDRTEPTLRVYEVPPGRTEALGMALNDVFMAAEGQAPAGKASSRIPGQLLVLAPDAMHASIDKTLGRLIGDADGGTPTNVQLRFWVLDAMPGSTGESSSDVPEPVLASLQQQFPQHAFLLYDQARLGIDGRNGNAHLQTARETRIQVDTWEEDDGLSGVLEVVTASEAGHVPLQTRIALPMDQYVVLAVTGPAVDDASAPRRVFIVQATSG